MPSLGIQVKNNLGPPMYRYNLLMPDSTNHPPLIIGFVSDLMFSTRIEQAAEKQGFQVLWVENQENLSDEQGDGLVSEPDPPSPAHKRERKRVYGEPLIGPGAALIRLLVEKQPVLLIFDLNNETVPWLEWIRLVTSVPATRRIPVLCFGSHMDVDSLKAARQAGAQVVVARSRFVQDLPDLIASHARRIDRQALEAACREPLHPLAIQGMEAFNRGEYYEAHELLEQAWNEDATPARELYRAILQVAVAYYHVERGNYNGAAKLFLRMQQWLEPLPDTCRGVDVARLRQDAERVRQAVETLGPEGIQQIDRSLFKPVQYQNLSD